MLNQITNTFNQITSTFNYYITFYDMCFLVYYIFRVQVLIINYIIQRDSHKSTD
jgi:hypothetical protein